MVGAVGVRKMFTLSYASLARRPLYDSKTGLMVVMITLGLLALADSSYVGSEGCAGCHARIYSDYVQTAMGRSLRRANEPEQLALAPSPVVVGGFKVFSRAGALYQSETEKDAYGTAIGETAYRLEYVMGSGENGFAYIVRSGKRLAEAPLSYYTKSKKWDLSPGYQDVEHGFQRPIVAACAGCHSGRPRPVARGLGLYEDPPFEQMAIGCENCHGPGRKHVLSAASGAIVNPAKLSRADRAKICADCHQDPAASPRADLLTHDSAMRQSKCYSASGGRLECTSCHDPHVKVSAADAPAYYRSKCLACHPQATDHGMMCTECHMPKRPLNLVPHTALTNHRIPIEP
jgi:hypothetical protein